MVSSPCLFFFLDGGMGGQQADVKNRGYLDFDDFRRFVKLLKGRPEIDRLYKRLIRLKNGEEGVFDFKTFEYFMREVQKVCVCVHIWVVLDATLTVL